MYREPRWICKHHILQALLLLLAAAVFDRCPAVRAVSGLCSFKVQTVLSGKLIIYSTFLNNLYLSTRILPFLL